VADFVERIMAMMAGHSKLCLSVCFLSVLAVALTVHYFIPGFSLPWAFCLLLLFSPSNAVSAGAIPNAIFKNQ
jgi:NhaP-type Na+/H+ or K+/H+ antiporter